MPRTDGTVSTLPNSTTSETQAEVPAIPVTLDYTSGKLALIEGTLVFEIKGNELCVYLYREAMQEQRTLVLFDRPVVRTTPEGLAVDANGAEDLKHGDTISAGGGSVRPDDVAEMDLGSCDEQNLAVLEIGNL